MSKNKENRMTVTKRGELEEITRRGSRNGSRPGSKASLKQESNASSATSSRFQSSIASSLQLLTPEEVLGQVIHFLNANYSCENLDDYHSKGIMYPFDSVINSKTRKVLPFQDYDLELEDYGSGDDTLTDDSEETTTVMDTGRTSSLFGIVEPPGARDGQQNQQLMPVESVDDEDYMLTRQITLFEGKICLNCSRLSV